MQTETQITLRESHPDEDGLIAVHFYRMWRDNDVLDDCIEPNWRETILQFITQARHELSYKAFIAEANRVVIGSVGCQLFAGLYPNILKE